MKQTIYLFIVLGYLFIVNWKLVVEKYSYSDNKWTRLTDMDYGRGDLAAGVMKVREGAIWMLKLKSYKLIV